MNQLPAVARAPLLLADLQATAESLGHPAARPLGHVAAALRDAPHTPETELLAHALLHHQWAPTPGGT